LPPTPTMPRQANREISEAMIDQQSQATLIQEIIKFAVSYSAYKSLPFFRRKLEHQLLSLLTVTHTDLTARKVSHLYTITVCMAQGALSPRRISGWICSPSGADMVIHLNSSS
jgi:hypothetical protein